MNRPFSPTTTGRAQFAQRPRGMPWGRPHLGRAHQRPPPPTPLRSGTIPDGSSRHAGGGRDMADNAARRPRRGRFIFFAVLLALVALLAPVFPRPPSPGVRAGFDQVQDGMTEQQVEELLGGPRGVYDRARRGTVMTAAGTGP